MGLSKSLPMLLLLIWPLLVKAQFPESSFISARALDALLQDYAYRAFNNPRTGIVYDGTVPKNLTGIKISAMRLRAGSLRNRGVDMYKEFHIPIGVYEQIYVERLVLVYQNLGNWSTVYYPLPGYMYLTPVIGLLAYDASDLSATNLSELDIRASAKPISIKFSDVKSVPKGSLPQCVSFDLQGSVNFSNLLPDNICSTFEQGHFSIVVESIAPSPSPQSLPPEKPKGKKNESKVWIIVGSVLGGLVFLILLGVLIMWVHKYKKRRTLKKMEKEADAGEALRIANVGSTRAPAAGETRTQPTLETEYVP